MCSLSQPGWKARLWPPQPAQMSYPAPAVTAGAGRISPSRLHSAIVQQAVSFIGCPSWWLLPVPEPRAGREEPLIFPAPPARPTHCASGAVRVSGQASQGIDHQNRGGHLAGHGHACACRPGSIQTRFSDRPAGGQFHRVSFMVAPPKPEPGRPGRSPRFPSRRPDTTLRPAGRYHGPVVVPDLTEQLPGW